MSVAPPPVPAWIAQALASDIEVEAAAAPPATEVPGVASSAPVVVPADAVPAVPTAAELDLAFCCDCTGSMGAYIRSAQDNIRAIAEAIHAKKGASCSLRFALVKYRDHPPQDTSYVTEVFPFTKSMDVMKANIDTMAASGGGDGPEAVTAGLHEVCQLNWRPNASKVCVFIADAPPHGLGENGDGFPDGCPLGYDPVAICRDMASKGIVVYSIGVEPVLSTSYKFARDFMMMVASVTEGKFLPLGKADVLADVIVSSSIEGLELEQLWVSVEESVKRDAEAKAEALTAEELYKRVDHRLREVQPKVVLQQVELSSPYSTATYDHSNVEALRAAPNLRAAKQALSATANPEVKRCCAAFEWSSQTLSTERTTMSSEQHSRVASRAVHRSVVSEWTSSSS